ncbi:hypothetical protein [Hydrogenoanaerobacterium sp.]|uniref:hypothetical protein n=1 Tax=Hydrogenoanaerobacterium sp. TaxID=2953763 RepID=UPI00289F9B03|nr:hypothetical protein [Hydrogenoanaerobacterium sp.]
MVNIFSRKKRDDTAVRELTLPILFFAILVALLMTGLGSISKSTDTERLKAAEQALRRAAVQCYALEGQYPKSLDYMEQNYGLVLDREQYVYHYQGIGANLMPQIAVFPIREAGQQKSSG